MTVDIGYKYNHFEVISKPYKLWLYNRWRTFVECKCICGKVLRKAIEKVQNHEGVSCGCSSNTKPKTYFMAEGQNKKCKVCLKTKNVSEFSKRIINEDKYCTMCRDCDKDRQLKRVYKIGLEEYEEILLKQNGKCAICRTKTPMNKNKKKNYKWFVIDHCHETGGVRGLLCDNCNIGIGHLGDTAKVLLRAYNYLKTFEDNSKQESTDNSFTYQNITITLGNEQSEHV